MLTSGKIHTVKAPATPEVLKRHVTVVDNPHNELSMTEHISRSSKTIQ